MLLRNQNTALAVREILELPEEMMWESVHITFGTEEVGTVTLEIFPTSEQFLALAELATRMVPR